MSSEEIIKAALANWDPAKAEDQSAYDCEAPDKDKQKRHHVPVQTQVSASAVKHAKGCNKASTRKHLEDYPLFAWAAEQKQLGSGLMRSDGIDHSCPFPMESAASLLKLVIDQSSLVSSEATGAGADHER